MYEVVVWRKLQPLPVAGRLVLVGFPNKATLWDPTGHVFFASVSPLGLFLHMAVLNAYICDGLLGHWRKDDASCLYFPPYCFLDLPADLRLHYAGDRTRGRDVLEDKTTKSPWKQNFKERHSECNKLFFFFSFKTKTLRDCSSFQTLIRLVQLFS